MVGGNLSSRGHVSAAPPSVKSATMSFEVRLTDHVFEWFSTKEPQRYLAALWMQGRNLYYRPQLQPPQ